MSQIYKYPVSPGEHEIVMPEGAKILTVQVQRDQPCIWAIVDPNAPEESRRFRVIPTGSSFKDEGLSYIGTFQLEGGMLVFHLFEVLK